MVTRSREIRGRASLAAALTGFLADPRLARVRLASAIDAEGTTFRYRAVAERWDGTTAESFDAGEIDASGRISLLLTFAGPLREVEDASARAPTAEVRGGVSDAPVERPGRGEPAVSHPSVAALVGGLGLSPHPEGGFYRETYRAPLSLARDALGPDFAGARAASTAIYFLVPVGTFSALHRIRSDEVWHFHVGAPLTISSLSVDGARTDARLGLDLANGEAPQVVVPAGAWFGARIEARDEGKGDYALVSCTVAPGFDFADFELGAREDLLRAFPQHRALVESLTRR
jgi:predicted cupin superfamily sugar epimerase